MENYAKGGWEVKCVRAFCTSGGKCRVLATVESDNVCFATKVTNQGTLAVDAPAACAVVEGGTLDF